MQVAQRIARIVHLEVDTLVAVAQVQLAAIIVVAIFDIDERLAKVRQPEQQLLLNFLELARRDSRTGRCCGYSGTKILLKADGVSGTRR